MFVFGSLLTFLATASSMATGTLLLFVGVFKYRVLTVYGVELDLINLMPYGLAAAIGFNFLSWLVRPRHTLLEGLDGLSSVFLAVMTYFVLIAYFRNEPVIGLEAALVANMLIVLAIVCAVDIARHLLIMTGVLTVANAPVPVGNEGMIAGVTILVLLAIIAFIVAFGIDTSKLKGFSGSFGAVATCSDTAKFVRATTRGVVLEVGRGCS